MATSAGYSGTPLAKKLGFKAGSHAHLIGAPWHNPQGDWAGVFSTCSKAALSASGWPLWLPGR